MTARSSSDANHQFPPFSFGGLRVLLVGPYPPPYGGPGVHMLYLAHELRRRGSVCEFLNLGARRRETLDLAIPVRSGVDFALKIWRKARRGFHIHHFFNVESRKAIVLAGTAAGISKLLGGTYSIGFIGGPHQNYLSKRSTPSAYLFRQVLAIARFVVCNNESVKARLASYCKDASKIHAIPCFHSAQISRIGEIDGYTREFMHRHEPVLSAIIHPRFETSNPHHELEVLITAFSSLRSSYPRIGCILIGGANSESIYTRMINEAGLEQHFHLAGEVKHVDCLAVLKASDIFIRAYTKDGSASSVREALALSTPTIGAANPQHPKAVMEFPPGNGQVLATIVRDTLSSLQEVRNRLSSYDPSEATAIECEVNLFRTRQATTRRNADTWDNS